MTTPYQERAKHRISVAVLCYNDDDQLLLGYHKQRQGWEFAGGGVEENEHPLHAAERELKEETGCEADQFRLAGLARDKSKPDLCCMVYTCKLTKHPVNGEGIPELPVPEPDVHEQWIWWEYPLGDSMNYSQCALDVMAVLGGEEAIYASPYADGPQSYEDVLKLVQNLPMTWYAAILVELAAVAYSKEVFNKGGASSLIKRVVEKG